MVNRVRRHGFDSHSGPEPVVPTKWAVDVEQLVELVHHMIG